MGDNDVTRAVKTEGTFNRDLGHAQEEVLEVLDQRMPGGGGVLRY